jgi:glycine/D-amino acid oxidase-like deaminating enzyme
MSSLYWADRTAENRRKSYPKYKGDATVDAVVIGGGLTGCSSAYTLAAAGIDVVLLEAGRLASGETAAGLGMIVPQPDAAFRAVEAARGRRVARLAWEAAQYGALDLAATLKKLAINCDLKPSATHVNAFGFGDGDVLKLFHNYRVQSVTEDREGPVYVTAREPGDVDALMNEIMPLRKD